MSSINNKTLLVLWDDLDQVVKRCEHGVAVGNQLVKMIKRRADIEQRYAKDLSSLHGAVAPSADPLCTFLGGSLGSVCLHLHDATVLCTQLDCFSCQNSFLSLAIVVVVVAVDLHLLLSLSFFV